MLVLTELKLQCTIVRDVLFVLNQIYYLYENVMIKHDYEHKIYTFMFLTLQEGDSKNGLSGDQGQSFS